MFAAFPILYHSLFRPIMWFGAIRSFWLYKFTKQYHTFAGDPVHHPGGRDCVAVD
jgi:hypothetical protein